jgi:hypothetical protein
MSLLDKYKDTKAEQAVITSLDKVKGRVGLYLRSGLQTVGTYLYNINDLRVGLSVVVAKVDNFYVILNRVTADAVRKSYSVPKTFNQEPYCSAEINEDIDTLEVGKSVDLTVSGKLYTKYKWSVKGGGYFTNVTNNSVTYNAPSYADEVTITLKSDDGTFCDSLIITIYSPICEATIGYTTQGMIVSQTQTLTVIDPVSGMTYHWELIGGGSLSEDEGLSIIYTAPATNPNCVGNAEIKLYNAYGSLCDTLKIAINAITGGWVMMYCCSIYTGGGYPGPWYQCYNFARCDGVFNWTTTSETCTDWGCPEYSGMFTYNKCTVEGLQDLRTEEDKQAGCCPPQLM